MKNKKENSVISVYDENGVYVSEKILEAFEKYLNIMFQNVNDI